MGQRLFREQDEELLRFSNKIKPIRPHARFVSPLKGLPKAIRPFITWLPPTPLVLSLRLPSYFIPFERLEDPPTHHDFSCPSFNSHKLLL